MVTESTEYSKSGSDAASAAVEDAAFSGNKTRPEEQLAAAEGETKGTGVSSRCITAGWKRSLS